MLHSTLISTVHHSLEEAANPTRTPCDSAGLIRVPISFELVSQIGTKHVVQGKSERLHLDPTRRGSLESISTRTITVNLQGIAHLPFGVYAYTSGMDRLWTPWRYAYITGSDKQARKGVPAELEAWPAEEDKHCVFCNLIASVDYAIAHGMAVEVAEKAANVIVRGEKCYVCLNAFPYASGHILIVPYVHSASLAELEGPVAEEIMRMAQRMETALRGVYHPDGINMGLNLGLAAGAGVAEHVHMHALPRWLGDTNCMTVTAETRILPEMLDTSWRRLRAELGIGV
jgi:ATP adenylyltransferase